ncbi:nucleotidyltransferase domain-containing protein [Candidatus Solincola sp.]|jgi:predicted nucleotidyltransferase|nr:nucleotidyltransferase domain-containing protein [Actinomycetota bacterium]MDI7253000.1 nucleotidyltransferase domain-containing protein [Actinomycetota bacterium]
MRQIRSFGSVVSIWLDREAAIEKLKAVAMRLKGSCPEVKEIRLIGSLARGDHIGTSDADILIVLHQSELNPVDRLKRYLPFFDLDLAVDVFPVTQHELDVLNSRRVGVGQDLLEGSVMLA